MKPLDGQTQTPSRKTPEQCKQDYLSRMRELRTPMDKLVEVLTLQAHAIDRLAASNEALVDAMMAQDEQDEDQPQRDMAGNLIRTS